MSEQNIGQASRINPLIRLILENPISAFNAAAILIGGAGVYWTNDARMTTIERDAVRSVMRLEKLENSAAMNSSSLQREIGEVKTSIKGLETSVQFLVNAQRRRPND